MADAVWVEQIDWTGSYGGQPVDGSFVSQNPFAQPGGEFNPNSSFRGDVDFRISVFGTTGTQPDLNNLIWSQELDSGTAGNNDGTQVTTTLLANELTSTNGLVYRYRSDESWGCRPCVWRRGIIGCPLRRYRRFRAPTRMMKINRDFNGNIFLGYVSPDTWVDPSWGWHFGSGGDNKAYHYDDLFDRPITELGDPAEDGKLIGNDLSIELTGSIIGDLDGSGGFSPADVDLLTAAIQSGNTNTEFDVNNDGLVNEDDCSYLVTDIVGTLRGDNDFDFEVDLLDFAELAVNYNQPGGWAQGDYNCDGVVDLIDFSELAINYNKSAGSAAALNVPEPSSHILVLLAYLLCSGRRRSRTTIPIKNLLTV